MLRFKHLCGGALLALGRRMTRITFLLLLVLLSAPGLVGAQGDEPPDGVIIESVEITGLAVSGGVRPGDLP